MAYRVDLTARASRNLRAIFHEIHGENSVAAQAWFNGLEKSVLSLSEHPARCPVTPEDAGLRHLLYGNNPHIYRIIFTIDGCNEVVTILHIRHGARKPLKAATRPGTTP